MKLEPLLKNKRGQIGRLDHATITFATIVIMLFIMAPTLLKVVLGVINPTVEALNQSGDPTFTEGANEIDNIKTTFLGLYEGIVLFMFLIVTLLIFVSAFFIDVSPFFAVFYAVLIIFLLMFAPEVMRVVDKIYDSGAFAQEVALIGSLDFMRQNFGIIIIAIGMISMLIIYAKIRYFGGS